MTKNTVIEVSTVRLKRLVYRAVYHFAEFDFFVLVAVFPDPVVDDDGIVERIAR